MVFGGNTSISIEALNNTQFAFMNGNLQRPSLLPILVALIITIAVASGLFNGKKWAVVVSIILAILSLISGVMTLNYISIIIAALSLYAGYVCWNHAFYNRAN